MSTSKLWLTLGGAVVVALASAPAHAGGFGVRFSYRSSPRCSSHYRTTSYTHCYTYCGPAPVVHYSTYVPVVRCDPVVVVRDCTPRVVVYRDYAPRRYYVTRKLHPRRTVRRTIQRAVHRSYPDWQSYGRSYYRHGHRPHHRYFSSGRHYRGGSFDIGFRYRR